MTRIHLALGVQDLERSQRFYTALFGEGPVKEKPGYAKFTPLLPPVNLSLNEGSNDVGLRGMNHFGIEVDSREAVAHARARMVSAGFSTVSEDGKTCCFALADKVWAVDPDGYRWEIYVVLADAEVHSLPAPTDSEVPCCAPQKEASCCPA